MSLVIGQITMGVYGNDNYRPLPDNYKKYIDYPVESCKISVILFGSMLPI